MYFQVIFDQELLKQISGRSDALNSLVIGEMRVFRITVSKLGQSLALWVKQLRFADLEALGENYSEENDLLQLNNFNKSQQLDCLIIFIIIPFSVIS